MSADKFMRRKDRVLSRRAQYLTYQDGSNVSMDLYFQIYEAILGIRKEEIDISNYTTTQLIATEYHINKYVFEPLLLEKITFTPSEYSIKMNSCLLKIQPKPDHAHLGNCVITNHQYIHGLCLEDGALTYEVICVYWPAAELMDTKFDKLSQSDEVLNESKIRSIISRRSSSIISYWR